jgi:hypothetical protein
MVVGGIDGAHLKGGREEAMNWPWPPPRRGDVVAVLFVIFVLVVAVLAGLKSMYPNHASNFGFGPGWTCTPAGQGEPVCIKDMPVKSSN